MEVVIDRAQHVRGMLDILDREMLEQLGAMPGERILEIGAGSGYNAALLAELVGPEGFVATVDIDDDIVRSARRNLDAAGFAAVVTLCDDGALGAPGYAPLATFPRPGCGKSASVAESSCRSRSAWRSG